MKALIISEDEKVYSVLNSALQKAGYDTIIYKWLLKALDNIEEIRPDCIVVSSSEYPRHWKTLVQFVKSGIGGDDVNIYLYEPNPMTKEDEDKAKILGITDYFTKLDPPLLDSVFCKKASAGLVIEEEKLPTIENIIDTENKEELLEKNENKTSGHFMFTHPLNQKYITGKFFDYNGKSLSCSVKSNISIDVNSVIDYFTFFDNLTTRNARVLVIDKLKVDEENLILIVEIKDLYEEI